MKTSMKIYPEKRKKSAKDGKVPLYLRIVHGGRKAEGRINLPSVSESKLVHWHQPTESFSRNNGLKHHNTALAALHTKFEQLLSELVLSREVSAVKLRDIMLSKIAKKETALMAIIEEHVEKKIMKDNTLAWGTKKNKRKSMNHLSVFLSRNYGENVTLADLSSGVGEQFVQYLVTEDCQSQKIAMTNESAASVLKYVKPLFRSLKKSGQLSNDPFEGINIKFKIRVQPRISQEEFQAIAKADLSDKGTTGLYRDLFLVMCYTGLSYCDIKALEKRDLSAGMIDTRRIKSDVIVRQYLVQQALDIIEKYAEAVEVKISQRCLPTRSLSKMNIHLKLIAAYSGVDAILTTKYARRFFRQSVSAAGITEPHVVKTIMGHNISNEMDVHYLTVTDNMLQTAKSQLEQRFNAMGS